VDLFEQRKLIIATMHGKEAVIAPLFEKSFGVDCITPNTLDTDFFGTFTGEIERTLTPLETVRLKCKEAMDLHNIDLGIANEGSFGAHPSLHFIPADEEWMILIDRKNDLEIIVKHISTKTNFSGKYIQSIEALEEFAKLIGFPEHALILRKEEGSKEYIHKGIKDWNTLKQLYTEIEKAFGGAFVETDMRAMNNPLRMKVIQETTEKLIAKIQSSCPNCSCPGFDIKEFKEGLPCEWCNRPTKSILSLLYHCNKCGFEKEEWFPKNKEKEDPQYCDYCNP
jgi:hypothetical protein